MANRALQIDAPAQLGHGIDPVRAELVARIRKFDSTFRPSGIDNAEMEARLARLEAFAMRVDAPGRLGCTPGRVVAQRDASPAASPKYDPRVTLIRAHDPSFDPTGKSDAYLDGYVSSLHGRVSATSSTTSEATTTDATTHEDESVVERAKAEMAARHQNAWRQPSRNKDANRGAESRTHMVNWHETADLERAALSVEDEPGDDDPVGRAQRSMAAKNASAWMAKPPTNS